MNKKKCPKCNSNMIDDCCVKCGYMTNGNISGTYKPDKNEDLKLYNKYFEEMNINKYKFLIFILESSYIAYKKHYLSATLIGFIDSIITALMWIITSIFVDGYSRLNIWISFLFLFMFIVYLIIKKIIYVMFANTICLKLDQIKINKIKESNDNYKIIFKNNKSNSIAFLILHIITNLLLFILVFTLLVR